MLHSLCPWMRLCVSDDFLWQQDDYGTGESGPHGHCRRLALSGILALAVPLGVVYEKGVVEVGVPPASPFWVPTTGAHC